MLVLEGLRADCLSLVESSPQVLDYEAVQRAKPCLYFKDLFLYVKDSHGQIQKGKEMGSNINWIDERSPFKKEKDYLDSTNTTNGWKTIINRDNFINCNACTRRIKVNQKMLWHVESDLKMHKPQDCKLW
jgi:hypothetical protein